MILFLLSFLFHLTFPIFFVLCVHWLRKKILSQILLLNFSLLTSAFLSELDQPVQMSCSSVPIILFFVHNKTIRKKFAHFRIFFRAFLKFHKNRKLLETQSFFTHIFIDEHNYCMLIIYFHFTLDLFVC